MMEQAISKNLKKSSFITRRRRKFAFYMAVLAIPLLQFIIFYIYVNFNSILLAFKNYSLTEGQSFVWFDNFKVVITDFTSNQVMITALKNTLLVFVLTLVIGTFLPIIVSYYIYKKKFLWSAFRIILFLPSIMSSLALVLAFRYVVTDAIPEIWQKLFGIKIPGLLDNDKLDFATILFFYFWFGFGSTFLIYTSSMCSIPESTSEAASIDGFSPFQEFIHITFPLIFPTFITYITINIGTLFTNQINLFSIKGRFADEKMWTVGYYIFKETSVADITGYPKLSALGILCTVIALPISLVVKKLLEKFGPSTER